MRSLLGSRHAASGLVIAAAVIAYPFLCTTPYLIGLGIFVGAMSIATVGLVLLLGYAHQLALGQAVFCMVGGYATAILVTRHGWDPLLALAMGAAAAMLLAYVVGKPILRLRGFTLAVASLALQLIFVALAKEIEVTGQALGIAGIPRFALLGLQLPNDIALYALVWATVGAFILIGINIDRSHEGRALKAIAASEVAAGSLGINAARSKLDMFVLSAGMASVSGSMMVHYLQIMEPTVFDFAYSLNLLTAVFVGGIFSVFGGVVGAAVFVGTREAMRDLGIPYLETLVMAGLTGTALIVFPGGLTGLLGRLHRRASGAARRSSAEAPPEACSSAAPYRTGGGLELRAASRSFGALRAVQALSFSVEPGSITAIIGPNGAGKTTAFNLISGFDPLGSGAILLDGKDIGHDLPDRIGRCGVARTFQTPLLFPTMSVLENVMCGAGRHVTSGLVAAALATPRVRREERKLRGIAWHALRQMDLAHLAHRPAADLAFGDQRLAEIARALALRPSLLLMDEPASGLNDADTEALGRLMLRINATGLTVLLIEHDLRLVMAVADHIVVMDQGVKIAEGSARDVRNDPAVISAYLGA